MDPLKHSIAQVRTGKRHQVLHSLNTQARFTLEYLNEALTNLKKFSPSEVELLRNDFLNRKDAWGTLDRGILGRLIDIDARVSCLPALVAGNGRLAQGTPVAESPSVETLGGGSVSPRASIAMKA